MNIIIKNVRLLAAPEPPFVGTRIDLLADDPESLTWGIYAAELAPGHEKITIDWGDGIQQEISVLSQITHTYASPGKYSVMLSGDIFSLRCGEPTTTSPFQTTYPKLIREIAISAVNLASLGSYCFGCANNLQLFTCAGSGLKRIAAQSFFSCTSLEGSVYLRDVIAVGNTAFKDSPLVAELHFAAKNEEKIKGLSGYETCFGAPNAKIVFDP